MPIKTAAMAAGTTRPSPRRRANSFVLSPVFMFGFASAVEVAWLGLSSSRADEGTAPRPPVERAIMWSPVASKSVSAAEMILFSRSKSRYRLFNIRVEREFGSPGGVGLMASWQSPLPGSMSILGPVPARNVKSDKGTWKVTFVLLVLANVKSKVLLLESILQSTLAPCSSFLGSSASRICRISSTT